MDKIKNIAKKIFTKEIILYGIFGVLTTVLNWVAFYGLVHILHMEENASNVISLVIAILFAYVTNSLFVFNSNLNWNEFAKFILGRALTFFLELAGFFILFNLIHIPDLISKVSISIIVIILNFFISKYFAFKKK